MEEDKSGLEFGAEDSLKTRPRNHGRRSEGEMDYFVPVLFNYQARQFKDHQNNPARRSQPGPWFPAGPMECHIVALATPGFHGAGDVFSRVFGTFLRRSKNGTRQKIHSRNLD
ncbi:MAG: hypothetical protein U5J95_08165 [Balneolaceae bacterium]|nr:hypothetical protein [Balneolaceae bacterium]